MIGRATLKSCKTMQPPQYTLSAISFWPYEKGRQLEPFHSKIADKLTDHNRSLDVESYLTVTSAVQARIMIYLYDFLLPIDHLLKSTKFYSNHVHQL